MLNIALFGPPGAGKGTQARKLVERYNLTYISTGEILRKEIAEETMIGKEAKSVIERGGLVSDEIIVRIIENSIKMNPYSHGFLFDGFPRTYTQAYILDGLLTRMNVKLSGLLSLDVEHEELVNRMLLRAKTENRADDKEDVIHNRMREYSEKTFPVKDFYKQQGKYFSIDGIGSIDEVNARLTSQIEEILSEKLLNVVLLGPPGSGKGTQAPKMAKKYNMVYISTGHLLREEIEKDSEFGRIIKEHVERGDVVPDDIAVRILEKELLKYKHSNIKGFIFKGFPSTLVQAYILEGLLMKNHTSVSLVLEIKASTLQSVKRLSARAKTPKARAYDKDIETILHRMEVYEKNSMKVLDFYKHDNNFISIDGDLDPTTTEEIISEIVEKAFKEIRM